MEWLQAAVLGVLQGLTEFLPISSSAHLRIYPELLGWDDPGAAFTAVTQIGTETAVICYFARDIGRIISAWFRSLSGGSAGWSLFGGSAGGRSGAGAGVVSSTSAAQVGAGPSLSTNSADSANRVDSAGRADGAGGVDSAGRAGVDGPAGRRSAEKRRHGRRRRPFDPQDARMGWFVIIGTVPIGVLGYLLKDVIEDDFRSLWIIGTTLVTLGVILAVADRVGRRDRSASDLTFRDAILVGVAQALALIPGVSRSGASISMGLFLGLDRATAARFAFLLAIPAVLGSGIFEWPSAMDEGSVYGIGPTILATVIAFLVGLGVIAWLFRWLERRSFTPFVAYRIALGLFTLAMLTSGAWSS